MFSPLKWHSCHHRPGYVHIIFCILARQRLMFSHLPHFNSILLISYINIIFVFMIRILLFILNKLYRCTNIQKLLKFTSSKFSISLILYTYKLIQTICYSYKQLIFQITNTDKCNLCIQEQNYTKFVVVTEIYLNINNNWIYSS